MSNPSLPPAAALVPPPAEVRRRLAEAIQEVDTLRAQLRVSERAAECGVIRSICESDQQGGATQ